MKTNILILIIFSFAVMITGAAVAQGKTVKANIKVFGNCGMCKQRIETALDKGGVKVASWDSKTKNLEVVYNSKKITELQIHELIAGVGHDTEKVKAKDEVYAELPFCCLYRDHDHSGMKDDKHSDH
jgi:periplasmic mercuric ion binding protein